MSHANVAPSSDARGARKAYTTPTVRAYGSIHEITLATGAGNTMPDSNGPVMPSKTA